MTANGTSRPRNAAEGESYLPTSVALDRLIAEAPAGGVSVDWIVDRLDERSFGLMMLVLGVFGLVPGIATIAGLLLLFPAVQMMLGREQAVLPRFVARWHIRTARLARTLDHVRPVLQRLERTVHPRWFSQFGRTKRVVGSIVMLLALSILSPIPLVHIVPAAVIVLISFAFLEEDGLLLMLGMVTAGISLAITGMTVWGAYHATEIIEDAL
jgi:hypothetical protein